MLLAEVRQLRAENAALRAALERFCQAEWYDPEYERCWYCESPVVIHTDDCIWLQGQETLAAIAPATPGESS